MAGVTLGWSAEMDLKAAEIVRDPQAYFKRARRDAESRIEREGVVPPMLGARALPDELKAGKSPR